MASRSTTLTHDTDFTVSLAGLRRIQVYPDDYSENRWVKDLWHILADPA
eukprot:gene2247-2963_t